jgi:hypothetical protein
MQNFDAVNLTDMGTQLRIGSQTSERAKDAIDALMQKYDLPIVTNSRPSLTDIKEQANEAIASINTELFDINADASVVFMNKDLELPEDMFMYKSSITLNPVKRKFMDTCIYQGRSKYFAIIARCSILKQIENLNV